MNIVWISPECPYPANTGGRLGIWKRIESFGKTDNIFFFCIDDDGISEDECNVIKKYCTEVHLYKRLSRGRALLKSFIYPYPAVSRWNTQMAEDISKCCTSNKIDYIFVDFPQMYRVLLKEIREQYKVVLHQHNIEFQSMSNLARGIKNPLKAFAYKVVARQLENYEKKIYKTEKLYLYTFVSSLDKKYFEETFDIYNTYLMPVGADFSFEDKVPKTHKVAYIGKMSYPGNIDGSIWFMDNVWDEVLKKIHDAELFLVGKDPSQSIYDCARRHKNITVTGTVDSVEPYYNQSQLIVVPLLSGGGVKVKLLEALGHGKLVVTTEKGIEGTEFCDGEHVLERNDAKGFAEACVDVLRNTEQYEKMRQRAIKKMENMYSWSGIVNDFRKYLEYSFIKK